MIVNCQLRMKNLHWLKGTVAIRDIAYHLIKGFHDGNMSATYRLYKEYGFLGRFFLMLKDVLDMCRIWARTHKKTNR